jgi:hypothetical protein
VVTDQSTPPGEVLVNVNFSPQGQTSALVVQRHAAA